MATPNKLQDSYTYPNHWHSDYLKNLVLFSRKPRDLEIPKEGIPFIPMEHISEGGSIYPKWEMRKKEEIRSGSYCEKGDILLPKITPSFENGKQAMVVGIPSPFAYATTEVFSFKSNSDQLDDRFLFHYFLNPMVRAELTAKMEGSTGRQRIPKEVLQNLEIPLPSIEEQQSIANLLGTVWRTIEATQAVLSAISALKRSMLKHFFTYGPVSMDNVNTIEQTETEIGSLPRDWNIAELKDLFQIQQGKALSKEHREGKSPSKFLRTSNVYWGRLDLSVIDQMDFTNDERRKLKLEKGDLLICEGGEIGRTALWNNELEDCYYQNHIFRARAKSELVHPAFYMYWMHASFTVLGLYQGYGTRTTISNLSKSRLGSFPVPLPPYSIQERIAGILSVLDQKLDAEEAHKQSLETLFTTLLAQLMTGTLRVSTSEMNSQLDRRKS